MEKLYVLKDEADNTKIAVVGASRTPPNAICEAPEGVTTADGDLIDLEDIIDEMTGEVTGKRAVVNQARKAAKDADKAAEKAQMDQARQDVANKRASLKALNVPTLNDVELRNAVKDLIELL